MIRLLRGSADRTMTENRAAQPEIMSALHWRQVVDSAVETAIIVLNSRGFITSWNAGATRILGWDERDMLGQTLDRIFPAGSSHLAAEIADARRYGRGGGEEGWRIRKDGSRIWAVGEVAPI